MKRAAFLCLIAFTAIAADADAQSIKINGLTTARYIELRPITTQQTVALVPFTQDLSVNVWGIGTGVRLYGEFRARAAAGDETDLWPQSDDKFDVVAAYAEVDRNRLRARAGRQWKTSPLGFYNFDGASLLFRASRQITAEVYGGWSLVPGESEYMTDAPIAGIEPYAPNVNNNIVGGELKLRLGTRAAVSGLYQREIRRDRAGLHSERAALDASYRPGLLSIEGGVEGDLANEVINEARLRFGVPFGAGFSASVEARRYRPYFDLWTVWGAFNPIGFSEAIATTQWQSREGTASIRVGGGMRSYEDDGGGVEFERLRDDGWRALVDAAWTPRPIVTFSGGYRADIGFGASRSQGDVSARMNFGRSNYISASAVAFQMINELQISDGTVYGAGTDGQVSLSSSSRIGWSLAVYRHENEKPATSTDWSQTRGSIFMEWTVGSNPDAKTVARAK